MASTKTRTKKVSKRKPPKDAPSAAGPQPVTVAYSSAQSTAQSPSKPRSKQTAGSKSKALRELAGELNKPNHRVIAVADEVPNTYELRRPSGVMQLDIDTGGGLPAGGLCYLTGPEGSGKTYLLYRYMAMHQQIYGENSCIAFAPLEAQFDFKWARQCGMKIRVPERMVEQWDAERRIRGVAPFTPEELASFSEQVGEFVLLGGNTGEEVLDTVLRCVEKGIFGIIGVDSVNGLLPGSTAAKDLDEEAKRAAHATLITRFMQKYIPKTTGLDGINETTLIFIQQVRSNPDKSSAPSYMQKYMKDWAASGAWAAKHFKLIDIVVWSGQDIKKDVAGEKRTLGKELRWDLEKGKAGTHDNISGSIAYYYEGGIDCISSIIVSGTRLGVIQERGDGVHIIQPETKEDARLGPIESIPMLHRLMQVDFEFELAVRREVLAAAGISCLYR